MRWQQTNGFELEFKKISKKQRGLDSGFEKAKRLLACYFDPASPNRTVIAPGKIHRITDYIDWEFWKLEVMVVGLKPSLWPRVWFAVSGDAITFLAIAMHNSNYTDAEIERLALERYDY